MNTMVIFPATAALVAFACSIVLLRDYITRPRPDKITWTIAFAIFGVAALAEFIGSVFGWTPLLARGYYVAGATVVVGYLALGELYLLLPKKHVDKIAALMVGLTALGISLIWNTPVGPNVSTDGWHALEAGAGLTALTIGINSVGTIILVGGCIYSAARFRKLGIMRNRMIGLTLIAAGTLVVASGGTLTRLGNAEYFYIAMTAGVSMIFAGYLRARKPDARPATARPAGERDEVTAPVSG
jgi:hypothetical protein